jgi:hypothetical protein
LVQAANPVITHDGKGLCSTLKHSTERAEEELRFLIRLRPSETLRGGLLAAVRGLARSVGVETRNAKWTSYGALELDVFCPARADLDVFLAAVSPIASPEFVTDLNRAPEHMTDEEVLSKARVLFNNERYWECHEVLEGIWRQKQGGEKRLLQGIILVCAAMVHHQKGEEAVALSVLNRAARLLDFPSDEYGGINLSRLRQDVQLMINQHGLSVFSV